MPNTSFAWSLFVESVGSSAVLPAAMVQPQESGVVGVHEIDIIQSTVSVVLPITAIVSLKYFSLSTIAAVGTFPAPSPDRPFPAPRPVGSFPRPTQLELTCAQPELS